MCNYLNFNQVIIILFYCWVVKILYVFLILISYQIYAFQKFPVVTHVAFLFHLLLIFWCTKFCNFDIKQFICFYFCYVRLAPYPRNHCYWIQCSRSWQLYNIKPFMHGFIFKLYSIGLCACLYDSFTLFLSWYLYNMFWFQKVWDILFIHSFIHFIDHFGYLKFLEILYEI